MESLLLEESAQDEPVISAEYAEAIEMLKEYIEAGGKGTAAKVARSFGISQTYISLFLKGTYPNPDTLIPRIHELIEVSKNKSEVPKEPNFKMTTVSKAVYGLIKYSHKRGKITVAYGDAGIGKTMAVQEYTRQYPDSTIVLEADPLYNSVPALYELLAIEMGISARGSRRIQQEAMRQLKGSNKIIIIDEAQLLSEKQIEAVRRFAEKCGIGLSFVGNHSIYTKMIGSGKQEFAQLFSRIGDDGQLLKRHISLRDIGMIFERYGLDDESLNYLHQISQTNYGVRGAVETYINAYMLHDGNVSLKFLKESGKKKIKR